MADCGIDYDKLNITKEKKELEFREKVQDKGTFMTKRLETSESIYTSKSQGQRIFPLIDKLLPKTNRFMAVRAGVEPEISSLAEKEE